MTRYISKNEYLCSKCNEFEINYDGLPDGWVEKQFYPDSEDNSTYFLCEDCKNHS